MNAVVLAAGYATRLHPLTRNHAKSLLEVGGKPILTRIVEQIVSTGAVDEIVVVSNSRFVSQFEAWATTLPASPPLRVIDDGSTAESDRLGAVGDLDLAIRTVGTPRDGWLVIAGDLVFDFDLAQLVERYRLHREPLLAVCGVELPLAPSPYSEVALDDAGRVLSFREKPAEHRTGRTALPLYLLPPSVEPLLAEYLREGGNRDAPGYFLEWLCGRVPVRAAAIDAPWFDVGTHESLALARRALAR